MHNERLATEIVALIFEDILDREDLKAVINGMSNDAFAGMHHHWRDIVQSKICLSDQEQEIFECLLAARKIQDFLWGDANFNLTEYIENDWLSTFQKRVDKIREIDFEAPHWKVEMRKRLLQQAALSIKAILNLDGK